MAIRANELSRWTWRYVVQSKGKILNFHYNNILSLYVMHLGNCRMQSQLFNRFSADCLYSINDYFL